MTRTNRTLYPDIIVVVDGRGDCESCDLGLGCARGSKLAPSLKSRLDSSLREGLQ